MENKSSKYLYNKRQYKNNTTFQHGGTRKIVQRINLLNMEPTNTERINPIISFNKRREMRDAMFGKNAFDGNIYILGCGGIGKALLQTLIKLFVNITDKITVIDQYDLRRHIQTPINRGVKYIQTEITKHNYKNILSTVKKDDLILDCAYGMSTVDFLLFCQEKQCHYVSSAIDQWDFKEYNNPLDASLYNKYIKIEKANKLIVNKKFTAVVAMGANPGNVSIWTKYGLDLINKKYNHKFKTYAELAYKLGVSVVQISEKDGQLNTKPKRPNEYCNTWSTDGESYYEEALGFVEGSWGTHEKTIPKNMAVNDNRHFVIDKLSLQASAQSYVPLYGRFVGNMIPHEETITIGQCLTLVEDNKIIYKPTVYYVYDPCNDAKNSLDELKDKNYEYQQYYRLLTKELSTGRDELGVTFYLDNGDIYWVGSLLSVEEAREIYDNEFNDYINATIVQVIAGYISAILYINKLIKKVNKGLSKHKGMVHPDNLPHNQILKYSMPFLGDFIFKKVTDFTLYKMDNSFTGRNVPTKDWQYGNFMVK